MSDDSKIAFRVAPLTQDYKSSILENINRAMNDGSQENG